MRFFLKNRVFEGFFEIWDWCNFRDKFNTCFKQNYSISVAKSVEFDPLSSYHRWALSKSFVLSLEIVAVSQKTLERRKEPRKM